MSPTAVPLLRRLLAAHKERSPLILVLQTPSNSLALLITKGDVRDVVGSEKHVMNFYVFIWRKAVSSYM